MGTPAVAAPPEPINDLGAFVPPGGRVGGIVLLGEAPGRNEIAQQRNFVGDAGKTLRKIFAKLGAPELEKVAYVLNAVPYHPPDNRKPTFEEVCYYRDYTLAQIRAAQPRLVIALGGTACQCLTRNKNAKVTHERGKLHDWAGLPVFVTLHPSFVRRAPANFRYFAADIAEAVRLARTGSRREPPKVEYRTIPEALAERVVDKVIASGGLHGADIETTGLDLQNDWILDVGIGLNPVGSPRKITAIFTGDFSLESPNVRALQRLFSSPALRWLGHHLKFDVAFLHKLRIPARVDEDTMLESYALDENQGGHDLKTLASELLGATPYDLPKKDKEHMELVPAAKRHLYLGFDVGYCEGLHEVLRPKVAADPDLEKLYTETLIPVANILTELEANGVKIDLEHLAKLDEKVTAERDAETTKLQTLLGDPDFNPKSSKQVLEIVYDKFRLPILKGIGRTTRELALTRLEDQLIARGLKDSPPCVFLAGMRKLRKLNKKKGTYIDGVRKKLAADGRVHTSFKQHGTRTGRLSSEKPNLHAVPREKDMRDIVCAEPDHILLELDWSQVELRLIADKSRDPGLVGIYVRDEDLHEEVRKSVIEPILPGLPKHEQRYQAKIVNFGTAYGRGEESMSREYGLPRETCKRIIDGWNHRFAIAYAWLESMGQWAVSGKPLVTRFGRKRRFGLITRELYHHIYNEGKNTTIQSEASDLTSRCAVVLREKLEEDIKIVNTVHDSLLLEMPDDAARVYHTVLTCVRTMQQFAADYFRSPVPFVVDAKVGTHWGHAAELPRLQELVNMPIEEFAKRFNLRGEPKDVSPCPMISIHDQPSGNPNQMPTSSDAVITTG